MEAHILDSEHPSELVRETVDRIRLVPEHARRYLEGRAEAARIHRIGPKFLGQLLAHGLPHRKTGADILFDHLDLANVGLTFALRSPTRMAMRWWAKSLTKLAPGRETRYGLNLSGSCPTPGHPEDCRFSLHPRLRDLVRPGTIREDAPGSYSFDIRLHSDVHHFGAWFDPLIDHVRPLRFHLLPYPVNTDLGFLAETGLADCRMAALHLHRAGTGLGVPMRVAAGYFVVPPYASVHVWPEVRDEDRWLPADPFLLQSLARWSIIDPAKWPPNRSPQGLLWRISDEYLELIRHGDTTVYPVTRITSIADHG